MKLTKLEKGYTIEDAPVLGSFTCSEAPIQRLNTLDSFDFAKKQGMTLESIAHAVVIRSTLLDAGHRAYKNINEQEKQQ